MLPEWLEAIILGIVQGLTEFIPVSSSGHLVLVPYLLGWEASSLAFDVMLHVGTLGAVLVYFRRELLAIAKGVLGMDRSPQGRIHRRLGLIIVVANVPVGIVGLTLDSQIESAFTSPLLVSALLLVTAGLLLLTERLRDRRISRTAHAPAVAVATAPAGDAGEAWQGDWRASAGDPGDAGTDHSGPIDLDPPVFPLGEDPDDPAGVDLSHISLRQAMVVGVLQCLAVLPGVSRSGSTIAAGVGAGLTREAAARFSFLLVIPALLGATALSAPDLAEGGEPALAVIVGTVAAFASGYLAIRYLIALVSRARLTVFAWYCVAASLLSFIGYLILGPVSTV